MTLPAGVPPETPTAESHAAALQALQDRLTALDTAQRNRLANAVARAEQVRDGAIESVLPALDASRGDGRRAADVVTSRIDWQFERAAGRGDDGTTPTAAERDEAFAALLRSYASARDRALALRQDDRADPALREVASRLVTRWRADLELAAWRDVLELALPEQKDARRRAIDRMLELLAGRTDRASVAERMWLGTLGD